MVVGAPAARLLVVGWWLLVGGWWLLVGGWWLVVFQKVSDFSFQISGISHLPLSTINDQPSTPPPSSVFRPYQRSTINKF